MKPDTIIWDFDGTILPSDPYDSEQTLLLYRLAAEQEKMSVFRRMVARVVIFADRKQWLGASFKKYYLWLLKGTPLEMLDRVAERLAKKITATDRRIYEDLHDRGYTMVVLSCGTFDLIKRTLTLAEIQKCFTVIKGNHFVCKDNRISDMEFRILKPEDKLEQIRSLNIPLENIMAVGDGYTDLPLLDRVDIPVMMDRTGLKKKRFAHKGYRFISTAAEVFDLVQK
jgi:phosphoserine phosphatase